MGSTSLPSKLIDAANFQSAQQLKSGPNPGVKIIQALLYAVHAPLTSTSLGEKRALYAIFGLSSIQ